MPPQHETVSKFNFASKKKTSRRSLLQIDKYFELTKINIKSKMSLLIFFKVKNRLHNYKNRLHNVKYLGFFTIKI